MEAGTMMTAEEAAEAARGLTFEKVWAMFQENREQMKEMSREADRRQVEADRRQAEVDRQIRELSKNIGGLNNSFGRWAEEMVSARLWEKFRALGYTFTQGGPQKYWEGSRTVLQVDLLLENGDYAMPVEIKSNLTVEDVDKQVERIGKLREQLDKRGDGRKLVGAVAGMVVAEHVRTYAQDRGLDGVVQSGDTVTVADAPEGFRARDW
jgi:phenylalanyl-tRNA synthetase alpha subunit